MISEARSLKCHTLCLALLEHSHYVQVIGNPKQTVGKSHIEKTLGLWVTGIAEFHWASNPTHQPCEWAILKMEWINSAQTGCFRWCWKYEQALPAHPCLNCRCRGQTSVFDPFTPQQYSQLIKLMSSWTVTLFLCLLDLCMRFFMVLIIKVCSLL